MNSNKKFDFYKNSIYFLIANAVLALVAIVILCVFGFNYGASLAHGKLILNISLFSIISLLLLFLYVGIRYDYTKALTMLFVSAHNMLLSTAVICLIRVPVTELLVAGYVLLVALTAVYSLLLTNKIKNVNLKKADFSEVIKTTINASVKQLAIYSAVVVALMFLSLIAFSGSAFGFVRLFLVMLVVLIYSAMTINLPVWCFLSTKIKKVNRTKVDTNVENQKVVKAVTLGDGEPTQTSKTE